MPRARLAGTRIFARRLHVARHDPEYRAIIGQINGPELLTRCPPENITDQLSEQPRVGVAKPTDTLELAGWIVAVKDNICTKDLPTRCASRILQGFCSPADATVVSLLRSAGMTVVGKANMDEFGMGSHSTHSPYGAVQNGKGKKARSAGGSSGGSAMAVLTDLCHVALGTDTGGSVRLPAAYTGLVGFKPSYGLISRHGVVPYANSLDTVGILAKTCGDVRQTFQTLQVPDPKDPTCLSASARERVLPALQNREKRRIGVPLEYNIAELDPAVRAAWVRMLSLLESRGHTIVQITLPATRQALSAYYVLAPAEASSNLAKYDGVRYGARHAVSKEASDGGDSNVTADDAADGLLYAASRGAHFGVEVQRRILLGAYSLSAAAMDNYFVQAQKIRRLVQRDFDAVFALPNPLLSRHATAQGDAGVDFIVCPTAPSPPPLLSELAAQSELERYTTDVFTVPASLAGLPAVSVPAPPAANVASPYAYEKPVGMQIIGQYGDDMSVLQFAESEVEWTQDWSGIRALVGTEYLR